MLTLSRRPGESIVIDHPQGQITITVLLIDGKKVRLGVEAAREIPVFRSELLARMQPSLPAPVDLGEVLPEGVID